MDNDEGRVLPGKSVCGAQVRADLLAFTLDKSSSGFSPTPRFRNYAISQVLVYWESQSVTRADSDTGRRYQHHSRTGTSIMFFARELPKSARSGFSGLEPT